jgi:hypothetical protein
MTGLFPELEPPAPAPEPTTAPLFDAEPSTVARPLAGSAAPVPDHHQPTGDVALFATVLELPNDTAAGPLALQFSVQ